MVILIFMGMVYMCDDPSKYENPSPYSDEGIAKNQRIHFFWWLVEMVILFYISYEIVKFIQFLLALF